MFLAWPDALLRFMQCVVDPRLHFKRCLAGKCDREDFFRMLYTGEQLEVALDEQFRLAGACRRLDDE
jgi:hypothetical protein